MGFVPNALITLPIAIVLMLLALVGIQMVSRRKAAS